MDARISIILPVFNTQELLSRCIESILAQTMEKIELLIIDDGSTDESGAIADSYAKADSRVRVIHRDNGGVSEARNTGLDAASGEYVMFVDSDDCVEPLFCERPYRAAVRHGADLVYFMHNCVGRNGKSRTIIAPFQDGIISKEEAMYINNHLAVTPWSFFGKKELMRACRFPSGRLCEDIGITHRYIHGAKRIVLIYSAIFDYTEGRRGSIWNTPSAKLFSDGYEMCMMRIADLEEWGYETAYLRQLLALYLLAHEGEKGRYGADCSRYLRSVRELHKDLTPLQKLMIRIYRRSPSLFGLICRVTGQRK